MIEMTENQGYSVALLNVGGGRYSGFNCELCKVYNY